MKLAQFLSQKGWIPEAQSLSSPRFLSRSIAPHVQKLSELFNRKEESLPDQGSYWKASSHPKNLKLAYFLSFMPPNLFRVASVWAELARLGFQWPFTGPLRALDLGSGPATAPCGILAGETHAPLGLPSEGNWALIERDRAVLELGVDWAMEYAQFVGERNWDYRKFVKKIDLQESLLPRSAPSFQLWTMSYFLNEASDLSPRDLAQRLLEAWTRHLDEEGVVIWIEPALKAQSRKLLEVRRELIALGESDPLMRVVLPCLGHQACGALAREEDWCHEEVVWWRPPYLRALDEMTGLDRKSLPFSYLVLTRSKRPVGEIFPALSGFRPQELHRLVSPSHKEGRDSEFFLCGEDGKSRARYRVPEGQDPPERGTILGGAELRGDLQARRLERVKKRV